MNIIQRNYVHVAGDGPVTMLFAHGFGCDQNMWRILAPQFSSRYRVVLFDLTGSGNSDLSAYDTVKYSRLDGYADDVLDVLDAVGAKETILVGHSVSAMICMLATIARPSQFLAQLMIGPSPYYLNDGDYHGGFERRDIEELLATMDCNYLGWSSSMAPAIMGAPGQPELAEELTNSFCRTDPTIARQFAEVTFLSDLRAQLPLSTVPALILQCSDDLIAPQSVGEYMHRRLPDSELALIDNVGHCPHLSAPHASVDAMRRFLAARGL
jgi:sigma-B regulation protein RsbQ